MAATRRRPAWDCWLAFDRPSGRRHCTDGPIDGNYWSDIVYDDAAFYSPNPDRPPYFVDLPVTFPSGELIQDVRDMWR